MFNKKFITAGVAALMLSLAMPSSISWAATKQNTTKMTAEEEEAAKAAEEAKKAAKKEAKKHKHDITALEIQGASAWKNKNFSSSLLDYSVNLKYTEREVFIKAKMYNPECDAKIDGVKVIPDKDGCIGAWIKPSVTSTLPDSIAIEISSSTGIKTYHVNFTRDGWAGLTDIGYTADVPVNEQVLDILSCEDMLRTIVADKDIQNKMTLPVYDSVMKWVITEGSDIGFATYSAKQGAAEGTFDKPVQFYFEKGDGDYFDVAPVAAYGRVTITEDQLAWFSHAYFGNSTLYKEMVNWDDTIDGGKVAGQQYYTINVTDDDLYGKVWFELSKYKTGSNGNLSITGSIYGKGKDGKKVKLGAVTFKFSEYIPQGDYSDLPVSYGKRFSFDSYTFRETSTAKAKEFRVNAGIN